MNTLSSGYSATAHRSVSGTPSVSTATEEEVPKKSPMAGLAGGRRNRIVAPPPTQFVGGEENLPEAVGGGEQRGKMLYAYQKSGDEEITVAEGQEVVVVEPDGEISLKSRVSQYINPPPTDGSGWLRVRTNPPSISTGLVPTAYVDLLPPSSTSSVPTSTRPTSTYSNTSSHTEGRKKGPAVAPKRGAKRLKYVEALYEYEARTEAEHSMAEGERLVVVARDAGDGWAEVEKGGRVGSVPANYLRDV